LNLHQKNVTSIDVQKLDTLHLTEKTVTSRDSFVYFYEVFTSYYDAEFKKKGYSKNDAEELILIEDAFHNFFLRYQSDLGHYWRNLDNILEFIDKKNPEAEFFYSNLLRAQLSSHELLLLFYNCLSHYGDKKFKPLIEKYYFLQNLPRQALIDMDKQFRLYSPSAFGRPGKN
jgi:hydroxymethylpyrimidine pyrophosphatase-like HAD family hydrolase